MPVHQNQRALRIETAELNVCFAETAAVIDLRVGSGTCDARNALDQFASRGVNLSLAYYKTLGRSADATFYADLSQEGYNGVGTEFRVLTPR